MGASRASVLWLCLLLLPAAVSGGELDGTQWKMRFRSARAWLHVWKADMLRFEAGRFADTECGSYGFAASEYVIQRDAGRVWRSTRYNADGERTDWTGVVEGDRMTGTFIWTRPDGKTRAYRFTAKRKTGLPAADSRG